MSTTDLFNEPVTEALPKTAAIRFQLEQLEQSLQRGDPNAIAASFDNLETAVTELRHRLEGGLPGGSAESEKDQWNAVAKTCHLPLVTKITSQRRRHLAARRKDKKWSANFAKALELIVQSAFLLGRNDKGWKANFDWLIANDSSVIKVLEGKYSGGSKTPNTGDIRAQIRALEETVRLHADNREGPNYRTGHSTPEGRAELAKLKSSLAGLRTQLQTTGAP